MNSLKNKVALVSGGSRGIGRGIACALADAGAKVAFTYNSSHNLALQVQEDIVSAGGTGYALQMSVEDRKSVRQALSEVKDKLGTVNILVNNAAIAQEKPFETITDEDWDKLMEINLRGPFICSQETLPMMVNIGWGRIINISSIGGQWGGFNQVHYAAAKAGLINFTRSLARIYSAKGITTNAVAPGLVQTDMSDHELATKDVQEKVKSIPKGRIGTVDEIASAVLFLASDRAEYITGQTINVNGGMLFGT